MRAAYNRQRRRSCGGRRALPHAVKHEREPWRKRAPKIAERRRTDAAHHRNLRGAAAAVEERRDVYRAASLERDDGSHERHRRALRRASVGGRAFCAALRLFRLLRSAGGVSAGVHGAGRSSQSYQQRIRKLIDEKPGELSGGVGGARVHRGEPHGGLDELEAGLDDEQFEAAVKMLQQAENIYVIGVRRSFRGGELHRLCVAAHAQARASRVGLRRHVSRADSQREEGRCGDRDQLRAVRQGDAVLRARRAASSARRRSSSPTASFRRSRVTRARICS